MDELKAETLSEINSTLGEMGARVNHNTLQSKTIAAYSGFRAYDASGGEAEIESAAGANNTLLLVARDNTQTNAGLAKSILPTDVPLPDGTLKNDSPVKVYYVVPAPGSTVDVWASN